MTRNLYLLSIIAIVAFHAEQSNGQNWEASYRNAQELLANGNADQAHASAQKCLSEYQKNQGAANTTYASILRLLQNTSYSIGDYEKGFAYSLNEITIRESKRDTLLAGAYQQAAQFCQQLGRFGEAIDFLKLDKEILLEYFKPAEPAIVEVDLLIGINHYLNDDETQAYATLTFALNPVQPSLQYESALGLLYLGMVDIDRDKPMEAIGALGLADNLYNSMGMEETVEKSLTLFNLGLANHRIKKFNEAEKYYDQAQKLLEKLEATESDVYLKILNERSVNLQALGNSALANEYLSKVKNHPGGEIAYAESLSNRASILQGQGALDQALELYHEALTLFDKNTKEGLIGYGTTLENLGVLYSEINEHEKSTKAIDEALVSFNKAFGENHPRVASVYGKKANILFHGFNYSEAKRVYEKAWKILSASPSPPQKEVSTILNGLARCYQAIGQFTMADSLYNHVLGFYGVIAKDDPNYLNTLNGLASSLQDQGKWNEARQLILKVKNILSKEPESHPRLLSNALENAGLINLRLGYTSDAKEQLDSSLTIIKTRGEGTLDYGLINLSLGRYYQVIGEYTKAESAYRQSNDIILQLKGQESILYAQAQNSLALLLQTMGNFLAAEPMFQNSLRIYESNYGKFNREYSTVLQNLATLYQLEEKYDKASPLFKEALEIDRKVLGESHPQFTTTQQNLATYYQKTGRQKQALPLLEGVLRTMERTTGKNSASYATAVSNLAAIHQDNKNFDASEKFWKESIEIRKRVLGENHPDYARSLYGMAALYHATGKLDLAKTFYEPVITSYQKQIKDFFPALSEKEKGAFYNKIKPAFDAYQDFCVEMIFKKPESSQEMIESLYNIQLSTKAILLNASNKVRNRILNGDNQELKDLYSEWQSNKETIVKLVNMSSADRKEQNVDLVRLENETNEIEKKLSQKSSLFSSAFEKDNYTWLDVQHSLKPGEAAVEVIRVKKKFIKDSIVYVGLVLSNNAKPSMVVWEYGLKLEGRYFRYHRNSIKHLILDQLSYAIFWKPIADKLGAATVVYLSCDGVFNKINPGTIYNPTTKGWVLDNRTVKVVSNTRELAEKQSLRSDIKSVGRIFGYPNYNLSDADGAAGKNRAISQYYGFEDGKIPPLPATEKEAQLIGKILTESNWKVSSFTKADATEDNFKKLNSPGIVHVATHGFFLSDLDVEDELSKDDATAIVKNPLFRSGLLLAGVSGSRSSDEVEDGILTAYEAMNLSLDQTELVALSACETGLGEVRNGEGVYGLQRAFNVAGAKAVLMSLWQVDDVATQELMTNFYSIWLKGKNKHEAFREAQLALKAKYPEPYFWGAFVLSGH